MQQKSSQIPPTILGMENAGGRLFIRTMFKGLTTKIMDLRKAWINKLLQLESGWEKAGAVGAVIVGGTSGVGKSMFAAHLMKYVRSLQSPSSIVYHNLLERKCYVMPPPPVADRVRCTVSEHFPLEMDDDQNLVYLVDVGTSARDNPRQTRGFTVLFASPQAKVKDVVRDWSKQRGLFPPCTCHAGP